MANEPTITIVGNLTGDPELRFTTSGDPVANFTVAATPRTKSTAGDWEDGETIFFACSAWRRMSVNVAESLNKGMRVLVQGRLKQRTYTTREGEKRTSLDLDVDEIGPSLSFATAVVTRCTNDPRPGTRTPRPAAPAADPWNSDGVPF